MLFGRSAEKRAERVLTVPSRGRGPCRTASLPMSSSLGIRGYVKVAIAAVGGCSKTARIDGPGHNWPGPIAVLEGLATLRNFPVLAENGQNLVPSGNPPFYHDRAGGPVFNGGFLHGPASNRISATGRNAPRSPVRKTTGAKTASFAKNGKTVLYGPRSGFTYSSVAIPGSSNQAAVCRISWRKLAKGDFVCFL